MPSTTAVRDTIERFHDAVNQRRADVIATLFAEKGVWEVAPPYGLRFAGRSAIEAGITGTLDATEVLVQSCGPIVVEFVDATHATARTSMQEFGRLRDGTSMHVAGTYHDALERQDDGAWRFVHRRFVAHYADDLPVPGRALFPSALAPASSP
ncbi:nuclear transport factor 2 family protein [Chondromyces crocatus]|nr:nuclear transport factor 2 family protein [Chondromyces crocatus]